MALTLHLQGSSTPLRLTQEHYLASGGEADLYKKRGVVYKVYHTPRSTAFASKLQWLKAHPIPNAAAIQDVLVSNADETLGYAMAYTKGCTLGQMFPTPWQQRNRWSDTNTEKVLRRMMETMACAHGLGCILVDGNEGNWLVDRDQPIAIDTDSWQIPGHKANAILPSIQDPTRHGFDAGSDWFSFAIVSFMLWTGMHPYKGMHPNYGKNALTERMKDGVSVLNSTVKVPAAMRDVARIPVGLRDWYASVFAHQTREAPPANWKASLASSVPSGKRSPTPPQGLTIIPLGVDIPTMVRTIDNRWGVDDQGYVRAWANPNANLGHADHAKGPFLRGVFLPKSAYLQDAWVANGRVFNRISESTHGLVEMQSFGQVKPEQWAVKTPWPCITQACQWFESSYVQTLMGSTFVHYIDKDAGIHMIRTPWLDGMRVHALVSTDLDNHWAVYAPRNGGNDYILVHFDRVGHVLYQETTDSTHCSGVALINGIGVVCTPNQWFIAKDTSRKQWSPGTASTYVLGSDDGLRVVSEINGKLVQLKPT